MVNDALAAKVSCSADGREVFQKCANGECSWGHLRIIVFSIIFKFLGVSLSVVLLIFGFQIHFKSKIHWPFNFISFISFNSFIPKHAEFVRLVVAQASEIATRLHKNTINGEIVMQALQVPPTAPNRATRRLIIRFRSWSCRRGSWPVRS